MGDIMLSNKKAVIFDLDGTLIDSMWMWKTIDIEYLERYGYELPSDLQGDIEGMSFTETAAYFKNRFHLTETLDEIKTEWNRMAYEKYSHDVPLKSGVLEFLKYLKANNIKTGIATSNSRELVDVALKNLGIEEYFDSLRTSCEVAKGKPSPDIYLLVADDLKVLAEDCLVFEDVVQGIMAGKNANMTVCAVDDEFSKDFEVEKRQVADHFIHTYHELLK